MKTLSIALAAAALVVATGAEAQQRWAFELRVNADAATEDIGEDDLGNGLGFEGAFRYRFMPHLAAYAGWDWTHFNPETSFAGANMDFEETGYVLGLRFEHPFRGEAPAADGWAWWLRAGGTYDHLEIEDDEGDVLADSSHGLGWEAGAGLAYGFGGVWSFTPGVRYRALTPEVEIGDVETEVDLSYVAFEVGIARRF